MTRRAFRPETMPRHPWYWLRWFVDECRDFLQRGWRGYTDNDVWNYGAWMCAVSEPMLNTWLRHGVGYHGEDEKEWLDRLESWKLGMAAGRLYWTYDNKESEPFTWYLNLYRQALRDMAEHAPCLWD